MTDDVGTERSAEPQGRRAPSARLGAATLAAMTAIAAAVVSAALPAAVPPAQAAQAIPPQAVAVRPADAAAPTGDPIALVTPEPAQWRSRCEGAACRSEIEVRVDPKHTMLRLWLGRSPEGGDYLAVIAPLGIYLPGTVQLSLDGGRSSVAAMPLLDCSPQGCRGVTPASPGLLAGLAKTEIVTVMMRDSRTRSRIGVAVPMTGFRDALVPMMLKRG